MHIKILTFLTVTKNKFNWEYKKNLILLLMFCFLKMRGINWLSKIWCTRHLYVRIWLRWRKFVYDVDHAKIVLFSTTISSQSLFYSLNSFMCTSIRSCISGCNIKTVNKEYRLFKHYYSFLLGISDFFWSFLTIYLSF